MDPIKYYRRSNYGAEPRIYIHHGETADALERMTGRKTCTDTDLETLTAFGARFEEIPDPRLRFEDSRGRQIQLPASRSPWASAREDRANAIDETRRGLRQ